MANCCQISATSETLSYSDQVFELLLTAFPVSLVKKLKIQIGCQWIHNISFQDPLVWVQWDQRLWISDKSAAKVAKRTPGDKTHLLFPYPPLKNEKLPGTRFVLERKLSKHGWRRVDNSGNRPFPPIHMEEERDISIKQLLAKMHMRKMLKDRRVKKKELLRMKL